MTYDLRDEVVRVNRAVEIALLREGKPAHWWRGMGSCLCGDVSITQWPDGRVLCEGITPWQRFSGRVEDCQVGYQTGQEARVIHRLALAGVEGDN